MLDMQNWYRFQIATLNLTLAGRAVNGTVTFCTKMLPFLISETKLINSMRANFIIHAIILTTQLRKHAIWTKSLLVALLYHCYSNRLD